MVTCHGENTHGKCENSRYDLQQHQLHDCGLNGHWWKHFRKSWRKYAMVCSWAVILRMCWFVNPRSMKYSLSLKVFISSVINVSRFWSLATASFVSLWDAAVVSPCFTTEILVSNCWWILSVCMRVSWSICSGVGFAAAWEEIVGGIGRAILYIQTTYFPDTLDTLYITFQTRCIFVADNTKITCIRRRQHAVTFVSCCDAVTFTFVSFVMSTVQVAGTPLSPTTGGEVGFIIHLGSLWALHMVSSSPLSPLDPPLTCPITFPASCWFRKYMVCRV